MTAIDHRQIVAGAFRVISLALGIPSSIAFAFLSWSEVRLHLSSPRISPAAPSGDALIDLLVSLGALTAIGRPVPLIASLALTAFSVYAIWALGWHFSS